MRSRLTLTGITGATSLNNPNLAAVPIAVSPPRIDCQRPRIRAAAQRHSRRAGDISLRKLSLA
eukprot:2837422-Pleurochrysis_carterae.AAC.1